MRFLSLLLCQIIALNPIWAQTNSVAPAESDLDAVLHVHVADDPGPAHPQSTSAKGYVVQVTNAGGAPVSGAAVALRLPDDGPTGRFSNGLRAWVAYSDSAGIARFPVIQWGEYSGQVELRVTAAKGTLHTGLIIAQEIGSDRPSVSVVSVPVEAAAVTPKPTLPLAPEIALQAPQPGTVSAPSEKPYSLTPNPPEASSGGAAEPAVSITNAPTGASGSHRSHKVLWILLAAGAAAGAGTVIALKGHKSGGGDSGSTSGVSVGTPTITLGH
jgi:hypothetical protein